MKILTPTKCIKIFILMVLLLPSLAVSVQAEDDQAEGTSQTDNGSDATEESYDGGDAPTPMRGLSSDNAAAEMRMGNGSSNLQLDPILSLDKIATKTQQLTDGRILDAELKSRRDHLRYEVKVLENDNRLRRYSFDARDGRLIGVK